MAKHGVAVRSRIFLLTAIFSSVLSPSLAIAQSITLDGTLGSTAPVPTFSSPPFNTVYDIRQNLGQTVGTNLFHSFAEFNLINQEAAFFRSTPDIRNIISRVTGGTASSIDGLIQTQSTNVNLYLLNPAGIIFGSNARLNVGSSTRGSFIATTLDTITFPSGDQFSATNPSNTNNLLTLVGDPSGFLASQKTPGGIVGLGSVLAVYPAQSLLLLGGDVMLIGADLSASGGHIGLGALADSGIVELNKDSNQVSFQLSDRAVRANLSMIGTNLDVRARNGGSLSLYARTIEISGSSLFAGIVNGIGETTSQAGDIQFDATGAVILQGNSAILNTVESGAGNGGRIHVRAQALSLSENSTLGTGNVSQGGAGSLKIQATESVEVGDRSVIAVVSANRGNGNDLAIETGRLNIQSKGSVFTSTQGTGKGGNLSIRAAEQVELSDSDLFANAVLGSGNGGNLLIETKQLSVSDGALISASTRSQGHGGRLLINASEFVQVVGESVDGRSSSAIGAVTQGIGDAGTLTINTRRLTIQDGALLSTSASNRGQGGNLTINASETVELLGNAPDGDTSELVADSTGSGNAGNLTINTQHLVVLDGATISTSTFNRGQGGSLTINASESVDLIGMTFYGNPSALTAQTSGVGSAGNMTINTRRLIVQGGAVALTRTLGQGSAGDLFVNASDSVDVIGTGIISLLPSALSTRTEGSGSAGDLMITTGKLSIRDGGLVSASTLSRGQGGNLKISASDSVELFGTTDDGNFSSLLSAQTQRSGTGGSLRIDTPNLIVGNGAQVTVGSFGSGAAGTLIINAPGLVQLFGVGSNGSAASGLYTRSEGTGLAGDLKITTGDLIIQDGAQIAVSNIGLGNAGTIEIKANSLQLDNRAGLVTEAASGNGGNILLQVRDLLLLRRGSKISTTAGTDREGGDGGNIKIDAKFIVAVLSENSDITANAFSGSGGRVNITAQGIYGLQFRPQLTEFSDITASSTFGISGVVTLNTPNVDPSRGLSQLPQNLIDTNRILENSCLVRDAASGGTFVITGTGGLPVRPGDAVLPTFATGGVRGIEENRRNGKDILDTQNSNSTIQTGGQIAEAQGIYKLPDGQVILSWECQK